MPQQRTSPHEHARDPDDSALLSRLRRGEAEAFEVLVRDLMPRLLVVARRMLRREEDARDAVQEAFVNAFKAIDSFEGQCRLSTWLHRIAINACLMRLRSLRRKPEDSIDALLPTFLEDGHTSTHTTEWRPDALSLMEQLEVREFVRTRIDQLPDSHRTVLILRDIEELSATETAQLLGIAEKLVKVRLHRARQALRTLLAPRFSRS